MYATAWRLLLCPAGARPNPSFSLREAFSCPAGYERSLGLRIEHSPPTRLRVRPSRHRPACGPSLLPSLARDAQSGPASPPAGLAARCPHASAPWLFSPAGRISPPPSRSRGSLRRLSGGFTIFASLRLPSQRREGAIRRRCGLVAYGAPCRVLLCPAGARPGPPFSLREAVLCPTGFERSLGLGVGPSPPTRLRVRPSRHRPACGPSLFPSLA